MINEKSTIAIPYYGSLVRPGRGLEQIFLKGDYNPQSHQVENVAVSVWDPKSEGRLHKWLAAQGVKKVCCRDHNERYEALLSEEGITVVDEDQDLLLGAGWA
ncbi:MAG: hypothetical protein C0624_06590 [Desulfuromonas sp.]|nr:MAG: hypothetical protein C0624_06590 [Desulfuromonas sp.]